MDQKKYIRNFTEEGREKQKQHLSEIRQKSMEKKREMKEITLKAKLMKLEPKIELAKKYDEYINNKMQQQPQPQPQEEEEIIVKKKPKVKANNKKKKKIIIYEADSDSSDSDEDIPIPPKSFKPQRNKKSQPIIKVYQNENEVVNKKPTKINYFAD